VNWKQGIAVAVGFVAGLAGAVALAVAEAARTWNDDHDD
jgi:hypothetical protein